MFIYPIHSPIFLHLFAWYEAWRSSIAVFTLVIDFICVCGYVGWMLVGSIDSGVVVMGWRKEEQEEMEREDSYGILIDWVIDWLIDVFVIVIYTLFITTVQLQLLQYDFTTYTIASNQPLPTSPKLT